MRFRCPNCLQQIRVDDTADETEETQDVVTCPSCNSQFNLASQENTVAALIEGARIDHFEIRRRLGEGTFGAVYLAWDTELEREVALKIPRGSDLRGDSSKLFLREARAAAGIEHPNVVGVHEIGQYNGSIYIACQYIDGITLREHMSACPASFEQMTARLMKILIAIHHFHEKGVIHRDIKPANILLDENDEPYVADFGLARREMPEEVTVTKSGHIVGTIGYMAPEQARGEIQSLSNRTDVYAIGVILYEMLTEQRPFTANSSHTVLHNIINHDPKPPRKLNPRVPHDLQTICLKALEKDQARRYQSAKEMADDLERFLNKQPIVAKPPTLLDVTLKLISRNRLTTLLLVAVVSLSLFAVLRRDTPPPGSIPVTISVNDPEAELEWELYDDFLKIPNRTPFKATSISDETVWLKPGLYRVSGRNPQGARHVVWRTIPDSADEPSREVMYPQSSWDVKDGEVVLLPFQLFNDKDIVDATASIRGGKTTFGYGKKIVESKHQFEVKDFHIGINEVSVERFKAVLNRPFREGANRTYLEMLIQKYGPIDHLNDDDPVRGFHIEVAQLYCELSGTRLPTTHEWEYVATNGGTTEFPTGDHPAAATPQEWKILSTTAATPDTTTDGVRNLFFSLGEYTDSCALSYDFVFPEIFGTKPVDDSQLRKLMPDPIEARGYPAVIIGGPESEPYTPKNRLKVRDRSRFDQRDTYDQLKWVGWRVCR